MCKIHRHKDRIGTFSFSTKGSVNSLGLGIHMPHLAKYDYDNKNKKKKQIKQANH